MGAHSKDNCQVHVWLSAEDRQFLDDLAAQRDQTVSAVVRSLLRTLRRQRERSGRSPAVEERPAP